MKKSKFLISELSSPIYEIAIYGAVGLTALITQDLCYLLLMSMQKYLICKQNYCIQINKNLAMIAMFIGNMLGMLIAYEGHNKFTFKKNKKTYKEFIKFFITSIIGLSFNLVSTFLLINIMRLNHSVGLIPTLIAPIITFIISKFWVFK